jgi:hypothetical protein
MHKLTALALATCCTLVSQAAMAQRPLNDYQWFDGLSISLGVASNKSTTTTTAAVEESGSSTVGVAKAGFIFPSDSRFKLGLSVSADTHKSSVSHEVSLNRKIPTELTLEPGYLVSPALLAYAKLGGYSASYATPFGNQGIHGQANGLGFKSLLNQRTFVQAEWTQHKANGSATLGWDKLKQSSTAVLVGVLY